LIPGNITEQVSLSKGGSSSMWGSGAVSGVLTLDSKGKKDYKFMNTTSIGSFGSFGENLSVNLSKGKWQSTSKLIHESSDRDFEYEVSTTLPNVRQTNASYHRNHFVQDLYFNVNENNQFAVNIWAYKASTNIPPTTVQTNSVAYQYDSAIRSVLSYKHTGKYSFLEGKVAYYRDHNNFYDPGILLEALNKFDSWFAELNGQIQKGNNTFSLGTTFNYTNAVSEGYKGSADEGKVGIFGTHQYEINRFNIKTSIRQEFIDDTIIPVTPNIAISYDPLSWILFYIKASRDFRNPTLNDRFWKPGGNQDLLPESGWSEEVGFKLHKKSSNLFTEYAATLFYRDIENWILWSPGQDVPYWAAQNINNVVSKGLEQSLSIKYDNDAIDVGLNISHNYISSAFQTALTLPKVEAGDQLLYTPKHTGRVTLSLGKEKWTSKYSHAFTGMTRGVNETLPAFQAGNLSISYNSILGNTRYSLNLNIYNLYNNRYFIIERRPIAGRNYNIGITIKY